MRQRKKVQTTVSAVYFKRGLWKWWCKHTNLLKQSRWQSIRCNYTSYHLHYYCRRWWSPFNWERTCTGIIMQGHPLFFFFNGWGWGRYFNSIKPNPLESICCCNACDVIIHYCSGSGTCRRSSAVWTINEILSKLVLFTLSELHECMLGN